MLLSYFVPNAMPSPVVIATTAIAMVAGGSHVFIKHYRSRQGVTLIHLALMLHDHLPEAWIDRVVRAMITIAGPDLLDVRTPVGLTPLHVAAAQCLSSCCVSLIRKGSNVSAIDGAGVTPLMYAVQSRTQLGPPTDRVDTVQVLLDAGAKPCEADAKNRTTVYHAARLCHTGTLRALLNSNRRGGGHDDALLDHEKDATSTSQQQLVQQPDSGGYTALHAAVLAGQNPTIVIICIRLLVRAGADLNAKARDGSTPLHVCARRQLGDEDGEIAVELVSHGATLHEQPNHLQTPIDSCHDVGPTKLSKLPTPVAFATNTFGASALHVACGACGTRGSIVVLRALLQHLKLQHLKLSMVTTADQVTANDTANDTNNSNTEVETPLFRALSSRDNDGFSALHMACTEPPADPLKPKCTTDGDIVPNTNTSTNTSASSNAEDDAVKLNKTLHLNRQRKLEIVRILVEAGANVNLEDYSDATPLIILAYREPSPQQLEIAQVLIDGGADVSLENEFGWGPLHVAISKNNPDLAALFRHHASPSYLTTFDAKKPRDLASKKYVSRCGAHNRLPLNLRRDILRNHHDVKGIAEWLLRKIKTSPHTPPKIVVLTGAGISTNAGIPDFRSPLTGLYSDTRFKTAFDAVGFRQDPRRLWTLARDVFGGIEQGTIKPTATHYFLRLLHSHGMLLRNYTQNIDGLEVVAGVPAECVVEAHGSIRTAHCVVCGHVARMDKVWSELRQEQESITIAKDDNMNADVDDNDNDNDNDNNNETKTKYKYKNNNNKNNHDNNNTTDSDNNNDFDATNARARTHFATTPTCQVCNDGSPYRPDITMFGEPLPRRFEQLNFVDCSTADLIIVMGTSLVVYPFAGLVNQVLPLAPRLLINKQLTGPFQFLAGKREVKLGESSSYRDAAFVGDCDQGVIQLCKELGWAEELDQLMT